MSVTPQLARACVPYTPFKRALGDSRVGLVTTAGVHPEGAEPFGDNDPTFRVIPGDAAASGLRVSAGHYDTTAADADINCVFPLDRLRALQREGLFRKVAETHFSMGLTTQLRKLKEETSWEIAEAVARTRPDAVVLTGG